MPAVNAFSDPGDAPSALASLGHELRTPLAAIAGYADAMRERAFGSLDDAYVQAAETIHAAASHMVALVDRLTAVAGAEGGRLVITRCDAGEIAHRVARMFEQQAKAAGVNLSIDTPANPTLVDADALALEQILINLTANALAAGGRRIVVSVSQGSADLILAVDDNGPGPAGTQQGLGLRIVRTLAAAHGGDFRLQSLPAGGARASARLPVPAPE